MKIYSQCQQCRNPFQVWFSISRHAGAYTAFLQHQLHGSPACTELPIPPCGAKGAASFPCCIRDDAPLHHSKAKGKSLDSAWWGGICQVERESFSLWALLCCSFTVCSPPPLTWLRYPPSSSQTKTPLSTPSTCPTTSACGRLISERATCSATSTSGRSQWQRR